MSADLSRLLKELQDFGVPEQRSCEIAAELIRVGARTVFAQLGEIRSNSDTPTGGRGYTVGVSPSIGISQYGVTQFASPKIVPSTVAYFGICGKATR